MGEEKNDCWSSQHPASSITNGTGGDFPDICPATRRNPPVIISLHPGRAPYQARRDGIAPPCRLPFWGPPQGGNSKKDIVIILRFSTPTRSLARVNRATKQASSELSALSDWGVALETDALRMVRRCHTHCCSDICCA